MQSFKEGRGNVPSLCAACSDRMLPTQVSSSPVVVLMLMMMMMMKAGLDWVHGATQVLAEVVGECFEDSFFKVQRRMAQAMNGRLISLLAT